MAHDSRGTPQEQFIKEHPGRVFRHYGEMICAVPIDINLRVTDEIKAVTRERLAEGVRQTYLGSNADVTDVLVERCFCGTLMVYEAGKDYMARMLGGAAFHSPRPLFTTSVPLVRPEWYQPRITRDAPWVAGPYANLCGTCRDNLTILLQMLYESDGTLDWSVRREFGNGIRALAIKGWKYFADHRPANPAAAPTKG